jgi:hypothetical protein
MKRRQRLSRDERAWKKGRIVALASLAVTCSTPIPIEPSALRDLRDGGECEVFADLLEDLGGRVRSIRVLHLLVTPIEPIEPHSVRPLRDGARWVWPLWRRRVLSGRPDELRAMWDAVVRDQPPTPFLPRAFLAVAMFGPPH